MESPSNQKLVVDSYIAGGNWAKTGLKRSMTALTGTVICEIFSIIIIMIIKNCNVIMPIFAVISIPVLTPYIVFKKWPRQSGMILLTSSDLPVGLGTEIY